jgi:3-oxoacyl-[acyl-carrier-protein] synthase II
MERMAAVVTGVGPLSAIGCGRNEFWDALTQGRHGFGPITLCDASRSPSQVAAEVKGFHLGGYVEHGDVLARRLPRPVQFALGAAILALHDAQVDLSACNPDRLGLAVGTSVGNLDDAFHSYQRWERDGTAPPHTAFYAFNHSAACFLSSFLDLRGPLLTLSQGCNSGLDALGQALRMIEAGSVDAMLVVGTDCEVAPPVLAALNASGSLSTRWNAEPGRASRPFDLKRDGNVIGEGAAGLFLESEAHARARKARIYARLEGFRIAAAGSGRTYSHDRPELDLAPCVRAFRGALSDAGWQAGDVDLVNANGSSSVLYDRVEALALAEVFGARLPEVRVHSQKSMLGQHGAGSSALQAVAACLALRRGSAPPTINCEEPDPACGPLRIVREAETFHPKRVLVHAIGLGGFYYSVGAFAAVPEAITNASGTFTVRWSPATAGRFIPVQEYQRPLTPWKPRGDLDEAWAPR